MMMTAASTQSKSNLTANKEDTSGVLQSTRKPRNLIKEAVASVTDQEELDIVESRSYLNLQNDDGSVERVVMLPSIRNVDNEFSSPLERDKQQAVTMDECFTVTTSPISSSTDTFDYMNRESSPLDPIDHEVIEAVEKGNSTMSPKHRPRSRNHGAVSLLNEAIVESNSSKTGSLAMTKVSRRCKPRSSQPRTPQSCYVKQQINEQTMVDITNPADDDPLENMIAIRNLGKTSEEVWSDVRNCRYLRGYEPPSMRIPSDPNQTVFGLSTADLYQQHLLRLATEVEAARTKRNRESEEASYQLLKPTAEELEAKHQYRKYMKELLKRMS